MNAILSGLTGTGFLIEGDRFYAINLDTPDEAVPVEETSIPYFFPDYRTLCFLEDVTAEKAVTKLQELYHGEEALDLALFLFDEELSDELRSEAAEALEELLQEHKVRFYLESVLYAKPLPPSADVKGALNATEKGNAISVSCFLRTLVERQEQIALTRRGWDALPQELFRSIEARTEAHSIVLDTGLFPKLVKGLISGKLDSFQSVAFLALQSVANYREIVESWVQLLGAQKTMPSRRPASSIFKPARTL